MASLTRGLQLLLLAAACAAAEHDPGQVLMRLRNLARSEAARIPNYTCVQTIDRQFFRPKTNVPLKSCLMLAALRKKLSLVETSADRFRLDVRVAGEEEMYSWVGASHFDEHPLHELIGSGPTSTGAFGAELITLFEDAPEFHFEGPKRLGGRRLFSYSFRVPVEKSHHTFVLRDKSAATVAYEGAILADPETSLPAQLTVVVGDLPMLARCCRLTVALDYHPVPIGAAEFLLPKEARQRFVLPGGTEVENRVTFAACREYRAESTVAFETGPAPGPSAAVASAPPAPLDAPSGLPLTIVLTRKIDSAVAAAGDPIMGKLLNPLLDGMRQLAPAGANVRGRVTRVVRNRKPDQVTVQLQADTIEIDGLDVPFRVTGQRPPRMSAGPATALRSRGVSIGEFPQMLLPGEDVLGCAQSHCVFAAGYRTEWFTGRRP